MINLLAKFNEYLSSEGLSKYSRKNYVSDVRRLLTYLSDQDSTFQLQNLSSPQLLPYLPHLESLDVPEQSKKRYVASINRFLTWGYSQKLLKRDLVLNGSLP